MKPLYYMLVFLMLSLGLPQLALGQASEKNLIGSWIFNHEASFLKMEKKLKDRFDSIPQAKRAAMERFYIGRQLFIDADGTYTQVLADGRKSTGTWVLNRNKWAIEVTDPSGQVHTQKIHALTGTALVLKLKRRGKTVGVLPELHFTKIKS